MKSEYDAVGIEFDSAATRVSRLTESVDVIRRLLDGEAVHIDGSHYQVHAEAGALAERIRDHQQRFGVSYWTVFDELPGRPSAMPAMAQVIALLR